MTQTRSAPKSLLEKHGVKRTPQTQGQAIRKFRRLRGISRKELAEAARLNKETLTRIENGEEEIRPKTLSRIAGRLKLPVACLQIMGYDAPAEHEAPEVQFLTSLQKLIRVITKAQQKARG